MMKEEDKEILDNPDIQPENPESTLGQDELSATAAEDNDDMASEALQMEIVELRDKLLRTLAEFENYKRRNARERAELIGTAGQGVMKALLPVLDDFERASQNGEVSDGIALIYQKLLRTLREKGLKPMESTGELFDPEYHEAITEFPAPSEDLKGKVVDTTERGYSLNDKIIRYAKVVVGK
jgi:molecular chaperone GrpE